MGKKLELTWFGKDKEIKIEPRILIENKELSNTANDAETENMLIHGDNLLTLKALEAKFKGKVKCVYIDPPYNTGSAFEHYNDNLEHSTWLSLMKPRLEILRNLLSDDGVIFIQIDSNEHCYLKVLLDEIFGRNNFIVDLVWRKKTGGGQDSEFFVIEHENILVYKKKNWKIIDNIESPLETDYSKIINGKKANLLKLEKWGTSPYKEDRPSLYYSIKDPDGNDFFPKAPDGRDGRWRKKPETLNVDHIKWEKRSGKWIPYEVLYYDEADDKKVKTRSIWTDFGNNTEAANEIKILLGAKSFDTPKPEKLIKKIIEISTEEDDIILDSFLGSGTTAAVAHKMGRKYIGIEMGEHAYTHCKVRLDKVIAGEDKGGITEAVEWKGGGGYRFYELAPSLIVKDDFGADIINPQYDANMLVSAVALHEGFVYSPDSEVFYKQSKGSEKSYLFVTTNHINKAYLDNIHSTLGSDEFLIISCKSYDKNLQKAYSNIVLKKIPQSLLDSCEFSHDNYNLNIVNPPVYEDEDEENEE